MEKLEKYNKELDYSYSFGAFPTFELINKMPDNAMCVLFHSKLIITEEIESLMNLCKGKNITIQYDDKIINKISDKENCFVVGVFNKFFGKNEVGTHLVLVNPGDMGNMGTIMRTMLGFGIKNLCVIKPCVDVFNPKVVRASMGAIFSLNIVEFDTLEEYLSSNTNLKYFFMLNGTNVLGQFEHTEKCFDLVFGNEGSGLPNNLLDEGKSVVIRHSHEIDSLNLPISVGVALYEFNKFEF